MPGLDVEDDHDSDSSDNDENHSKLLSSISQLDSTQRVRPAERKEPASKVSEFNLSRVAGSKPISAKDLAKSFGAKGEHVALLKKIGEISKGSKTLPKPLEKPTEERLKRAVGFEKVRTDLEKWSAIVTRNALNDSLHFPLNRSSVKLQDSKEFLTHFKNKTPLEEEIEKILKEDVQAEEEEEEDEEFPLTLEEMLEKRKEMAQLRAKLSYRQAKAQRQSKIKSKKYHRLLKREKLREQLKEFEVLQKTDPEAALKKLSELDRTRAQERASLRHRNTGQWARNLTVKAKYDVETRKVLAEQLRMSREMTQKVSQAEDSDSEEGEKADENVPPVRAPKGASGENPWVLEVSKEVKDFVSGYRKFWNEKNKSEQEKPNRQAPAEGKTNKEESGKAVKALSPTAEEPNDSSRQTEATDSKGSEKSPTAKKSKGRPETKTTDSKEKLNGEEKRPKAKRKRRKRKKAGPEEMKTFVSIQPTSGVWIVTAAEEPTPKKPKEGKKRKAEDIDELFDDLNEKILKKAEKKAERMKRKLKKATGKRRKEEQEGSEEEMDLSLKHKVAVERPDMDLGLLEGGEEEVGESGKMVNGAGSSAAPSIDPKSFIQVKPKRLRTSLPEGDVGNVELDDDREQQKLMEEAFGDDDVAAEFEEMKKQEEGSSTVEIDTTLPGWGSWTGSGAKPQRKKQLLVVSVPPRKDRERKDVIMNEKENPNVKGHLVKDVPHPFRSVEAFEAHMRAPVGREWVPETAHHKLIQKAVVTKLGSVIEPMSEEEIVQLRKVWKSPFKGKGKSANK